MLRRRRSTSPAALLVGVATFVAVAAAACSGASVPGATPDTATDPAQVVRDATATLRQRPMAAITVEATVRASGSTTDHPITATGVLSAADGGRAHLTAEVPGVARPVETYLAGDDVVVTSTLPDIDRPWTRFDTSALDAATAPDRERVLPSTDEAVMLAVHAREPSPLTALEVLDHATTVESLGAEEVDGRTLQRYEATTPADDALDAYGSAFAAQASVDCRTGVTTTVWLDDAGALARLQSEFDHLALGGSLVVTFADGEVDEGQDASLDLPPADQTYDLTAMVTTVRPGPRRASDWPRPLPCGDAAALPGWWARACPGDTAELGAAWGELARRAERNPLAPARAWLAFTEPRPVADAIAVGPSARVTGFVAVYPSTGTMTTTATFSGVDVRNADDVVVQIRNRASETDDASDPKLAAVLVDGAWQTLADEAVDCAYRVPELAPWAPAPPAGAP